jgi:hypothetical protein
MRGVRLTTEGWEGQCDKCRQWWPLDREFWHPRSGMRRCLACIREERRVYLRDLRRDNPEMRALHRERSRENQAVKRKLSRESYLEYQRRWYATNHVRLNAEAAERHAIHNELAGVTARRSPRDETPETLAYRAAFRKRWIAEHGPVIVGDPEPVDLVERRRARKREWQRRYRARMRAA